MFLKRQHNTDIGLYYIMLRLMETSKTHFVTLSSTGYRRSIIFYESADKRKKKIRFLALIPLSRARERVPESFFISVMCFSTTFALLTEPNHDAHNNAIN